MPFRPIFISLIVYAFVFNPNLVKLPLIQRNDWLASLFTPQVYFLAVSLGFIFFYAQVKEFFIRYLTGSVFKNIGFGFLYACIPPLLTFVFLGFYSLYHYTTQGGQWFIPWEGTFNCPYTRLDLIFLWILAPISEEFYFRGLIFPALKKRHSLHVAVIISALLFMSTHGVYHIGSLFLGIIMAYATHYHKSLWPAISYHMLANMYVPVMCWYFPKGLQFFENFAGWFFYR